MATAKLKCRVCGKEYEGCRSAKRVEGVFRWKDVACSVECGAIYLDLIRKSRAKQIDAVAKTEIQQAKVKVEEQVLFELDDEDEDEDFFDDELEDDESEM